MAIYEIILRGEDDDDSEAAVGATKQISAPTTTSPQQSDKKASGRGAITGLAVYHYAKATTNQLISTRVRVVGVQAGQVEAQQRREFLYQTGQNAFNMLESIAIGAMAGGSPGAVLGAAFSVVNTALSIAGKSREIQAQQTVDVQGIMLANIRAGTQGSRGSRI